MLMVNQNDLQIKKHNENNETKAPENEIESDNLSLSEKQKPKYFSDSGLASLLAVFGVAFLISFFVFQILLVPIKVIGESMKPTINASVLSNEDVSHCDYVYYSSPKNLKNDDIIIVKNNGYIDGEMKDENFIKRIVACPGQTIIFTVEDLIEEKYSCTVKDQNENVIQVEDSFLEDGTMALYEPTSLSYFIKFPFYQDFYNHLKFSGIFTLTLGESEYFIMGDNRDKSTDSRFFGPVKREDITGKVQLQVKYGETLIQSILEKLKNLI